MIFDMDKRIQAVYDALSAQCAKREYCESDILRKAAERLDGDREAASEVLETLVGERFVDNARYAAAFAREKSSLQGWGTVKIRYMLRAKGVSESDIAAGLAEIEPEKASARLDKLLESKWKTLAEDPQGKFKLIKFALTRGYDYPEVEAALRKITG